MPRRQDWAEEGVGADEDGSGKTGRAEVSRTNARGPLATVSLLSGGQGPV